jgi:hypothetical protein
VASELNYFGKITETGLSVIAKVYNSNGAQVGADVLCTEAGTLAIYVGDMPTAIIGQYGVRFFGGVTLLGQGSINWDGTIEIDFNLDSKVSDIETKLQADARQALLIAEHDQTQVAIGSLSFDDAAILTAIANLNNVTPEEVRAAFDEVEFKDKNIEAEIHAWLDSYENKYDWRSPSNLGQVIRGLIIKPSVIYGEIKNNKISATTKKE